MKKITLFVVATLIVMSGFSQKRDYPTGLIFDNKSYDAMPRKARLTEKAYKSAPSSVSLKIYCPEIGDQGSNGTCVGWSTAWAMRTIIEAKQKNLTKTAEINDLVFSPAFNYYFATDRENFSCSAGARLPEAINSMVDRGVPLLSDFSTPCTSEISPSVIEKAKKYKLKGANRLFDTDATNDIKISSVKTALSNGNPVVFGMAVPSSFFTAKGCWAPSPGEPPQGGHAICVVGYDDNKYRGAFEIMNSWGSSWGNDGFIWAKYEDFANYTKYAFEAYPETNTPQGVTIAGTVKLISNSGTELQVVKNKELSVKGQTVIEEVGIGDYLLSNPLSSGSRYRLLITANQSVYVYVVSSDLTNAVSQLFPVRSESAFLSYSANEVALPSEKSWIQLDNTVGKDFTCVIYSTKELDINSITGKIKSASGSFVEKIQGALAGGLIPRSNITLDPTKIKFDARADQKSVAAIIIEINHQ